MNVCHVTINGFNKYKAIAIYPLILLPVIDLVRLNKAKAATIDKNS